MIFAVFGSCCQALHRDSLKGFFDAIARRDSGAALLVDSEFMAYLDSLGILPGMARELTPDNLESADMALSFGGDGTLLRAARRVAPHEIELIGVNTGHLGYLAAVMPSDPDAVVGRLYDGHFRVESRSMLLVKLVDSATGLPDDLSLGSALNEVAVLKQDSASMVSVEARIDGELIADYSADGLLVSTPTGSTGYNLSAGGPILAPGTGVWAITPVAAHTLTMRPLVVSDESTVTLTVNSRSGSFLLSLDGSSMTLSSGMTVAVTKAPFVTRIVIGRNHSFIDSLREKLLWGVKQC